MCKHITCFDATSYLQLQEQGPQWLCPLCNSSAPFDQLAVDEYAKEILEKTSDSEEQVTIEPDGSWKSQSAVERETRSNGYSGNSAKIEDDDDLLILSTPYFNGLDGFGTPSRALATGSSTPTPQQPPAATARSGGAKRTAEVIDLTFSSDEDEPVARPAKRQNVGSDPILDVLPFPNYNA